MIVIFELWRRFPSLDHDHISLPHKMFRAISQMLLSFAHTSPSNTQTCFLQLDSSLPSTLVLPANRRHLLCMGSSHVDRFNDYRYRSEIKSKTIGLYQITDVTDLYKIENNKSASKLQTLQALQTLQTLQFLIKSGYWQDHGRLLEVLWCVACCVLCGTCDVYVCTCSCVVLCCAVLSCVVWC